MPDPVRVMVEEAKKKRSVASAFDWPGWDRSAKIGADVLAVLESYRPRFAKVAARAGLAEEFAAAGELEVVERLPGSGMSDFYGTSGTTAAPEYEQMTEAECERKIALLEACWGTLDDMTARASAELRKGPRGGGRDRDHMYRHTNGAEILDFATRVGIRTSPDALDSPAAMRAHRGAFVAAIREHNARGPAAKTWTVQFLIRRCAYHQLDHAWEMEDRDLAPAP